MNEYDSLYDRVDELDVVHRVISNKLETAAGHHVYFEDLKRRKPDGFGNL